MRDDLDTLLADVGREPSATPDVDAIHARGRRRAVARRAVTTVGALAVVGVVAVGIQTLAARPSLPPIGDLPPVTTSEDDGTADGAGSTEHPGTGADEGVMLQAVPELGVSGVLLQRSEDGAGGLGMRIATTEGVGEARIAPGALPPEGSDLVVDDDARVWLTDVDGNLLSDAADDESVRLEGPADDVGGWAVVGLSHEGRPLVVPVTTSAPEVFEWGPDGVPAPIPGLSLEGRVPTGARPVAAATAPERLAVILELADGTRRIDVLEAGFPDNDFTLEFAGDAVRRPLDLAFVNDEVWFLQASPDGEVDLVVLTTDGAPPLAVATPIGREVVGTATDLDVAASDVVGPAGVVVALSVRTEDGREVSWLVDPEVARESLGEPGTTAEAPDAFTPLLEPGRLSLTPLPPHVTYTPACGADGSVFSPPGPEPDLWFICDGAEAPDGWPWPFARVERPGMAAPVDAEGLRLLLDSWAQGPTVEEQARGLVGGLDAETATFGEVTVDGTAVTVDVLAGPEVGVLGTSGGGSAFMTAVVGIVLQDDGLRTVTFTLDGSCTAWESLRESGEEACTVHEASDAPWIQ